MNDLPYRLALAGGWIDQPFVSMLHPGSMVVVSIHPTVEFMERAGMATGTRKVARRLWGDRLPEGDPELLMRELYAAENQRLAEPSGSQDMAGLLFPGINRLDYDAAHEGGYFPAHIEHCLDPDIALWLQSVIHLIPIAPRPPGYNPLGIRALDLGIVRELGESGKDCYASIVRKDMRGLGDSLNRTAACWDQMLPHVFRHPSIDVDLPELLRRYQADYAGALTSGCGGGYLYVVSPDPPPGSFKVEVRL